MKRCSGCKTNKPLDAFCSNRAMRDGLSNWCRACKSALHQKTKHLHYARQKRWRDRLKHDVFLGYGGKCACCGESRAAFLTIDHIYGDGASERKRVSTHAMYYRLKSQGFPRDRYQVLCMNCNWGKRVNKNVCPHQTEPTGEHQ